MDPGPERRVGIVRDEREALRSGRGSRKGERRRSIGAVAGVLRRDERAVGECRTPDLHDRTSSNEGTEKKTEERGRRSHDPILHAAWAPGGVRRLLV